MPRIIETTASGSPVPDFLTQSPRTPFNAGKVYTVGDILWGYSGMVDFDITASTSYDLIRFTLERNAMINCGFNCDWNVLEGSSSDTGCEISIDGTSIIRVAWENQQIRYGSGRSPWYANFFLPAERDCHIVVLNPDAGADLLQANVTLSGQYL